MAVSVAHPAAIPMFKGDSFDLLDRLVDACNAPRASALCPLRERELVSFDWESWALPPSSAAAASTSPSVNASRASGRRNETGDRKSCAPSPTKASGSNKRAVSPTNSSSTKSPPRKHSASPATPTPIKHNPRASSCSGSAADAAACPGFFSSPKPEALPMPTSGLLSRAACVKA